MRADPLARRFGHGAANFRVAAEPLAPVPPVSPLAGAGSAAATVVASGLIVFAGIRALDTSDSRSSALRIVPMQAQVVAEPPEVDPVAEPEPAPVPPEPAPAPVVVAKKTVPIRRMPAPAPVPVEPETRKAWRPPAAAAGASPRAKPPRFAIDAVSGSVPAEPENPARVASLPPGVAASRRVPAPTLPRVAPPATRTAPVRPVSFAGAADTRTVAPARETSAALRERVAAAPLPAPARRAEPEAKLRGVPLSALAACRTDQREDSLKLAVLAAVGTRRECSNAAGSYRFVETKNLNAFLMWIERAPGRTAVDRCVELAHALSCLSGPGSK